MKIYAAKIRSGKYQQQRVLKKDFTRIPVLPDYSQYCPGQLNDNHTAKRKNQIT